MCIYTHFCNILSHTYWLTIFIVLIRGYREKWDRKERELKHIVNKWSLVYSKSLTFVLQQLFSYSAHTSCSINIEFLKLICFAPAQSSVDCMVHHDFCLSATFVLTTCTPSHPKSQKNFWESSHMWKTKHDLQVSNKKISGVWRIWLTHKNVSCTRVVFGL